MCRNPVIEVLALRECLADIIERPRAQWVLDVVHTVRRARPLRILAVPLQWIFVHRAGLVPERPVHHGDVETNPFDGVAHVLLAKLTTHDALAHHLVQMSAVAEGCELRNNLFGRFHSGESTMVDVTEQSPEIRLAHHEASEGVGACNPILRTLLMLRRGAHHGPSVARVEAESGPCPEECHVQPINLEWFIGIKERVAIPFGDLGAPVNNSVAPRKTGHDTPVGLLLHFLSALLVVPLIASEVAESP